MDVVIKKYDHRFRNQSRFLTEDSWADLSEFYARGGRDLENYIEIEDGQIAVLKSILIDLGMKEFKIIYVEDPFSEIYPWHYNIDSLDKLGKESLDYFIQFKPHAGMKVSIDDIENLIKGCLRNIYWLAIDFDYDGYIRTHEEMHLFVGCNRDFIWIDQPGVHVDIDPDGPGPIARLGRDLDG